MNELIQSTKLSLDAAGLVSAFFAGKNQGTISAYKKDLADFTKFVNANSLEESARMLLGAHQGQANAVALSYQAQLIERKLSPSTVNRRLAALKSLVKLAGVVGLCSFTLSVKGVAVEPLRDTRGPGEEGVKKLLSSLEGKTDAKSVRDRAMVMLMYGHALRRGEVCSLNMEHIEGDCLAVWILGKGRKQRQRVTLHVKVQEALRSWREARGEALGSDPLFIALDPKAQGKRLAGDGLGRLLKKQGKKAGIVVRPHGLRHAAITRALDKMNGDLRKVRSYSRHKSLDMLLIYDDARKDFAAEVSERIFDAE
jgi:integrase/recombinase XerC